MSLNALIGKRISNYEYKWKVFNSIPILYSWACLCERDGVRHRERDTVCLCVRAICVCVCVCEEKGDTLCVCVCACACACACVRHGERLSVCEKASGIVSVSELHDQRVVIRHQGLLV